MSTESSISKILFRSAILASLAAAACVDTPEVEEDQLALAPSYKATVKNRTLSITGNSAASSLSLRLGATTTTLEVDVGDDGTADFRFDRSTFEKIRIDAGGGNDMVTMNEQAGAFTHEERVTIIGGGGDDTLFGGVGPDTILGGTGNDIVHGRYSSDTISLGGGDDRVVWEPGGASDVVEGDGGADTLSFTMANVGEEIDLSASGDRLRLTRNVATIALDLHGVEIVDLRALGGADRIVVNDLADALVDRVNVDLSYLDGQGDAQPDAVVVNGTAEADIVDVWREGTAVVAAGHYTEVSVTGGEPALDRMIVDGDASDRVNIDGSPEADSMFVHSDASGLLFDGGGFNVLVAPAALAKVKVLGLGGDDTITNPGTVTTPLDLDGGDGDDRLVGGAAADVLRGGPGNDVVDGWYGADTAFLGDGDDTYLWHPGGASDVIEGEGGSDVLIFTTSNVGESLDLRSNGGRVALYRDVASVTMDVDGIERFHLRTLGGADSIVVNPLTGTSATQVDVDLAASLDGTTGDAQPDRVAVNGNYGLDAVDVRADGNAVAATGLGVIVNVVNGEPALDRMFVYGGELAVNGSDAADTMVVYQEASGAVYDGGGFNVLVAAAGVTQATMLGHGGDDVISAPSVTVPLILDGGDGDDRITGGHAADVLRGGAGNDIVDGRPGADTALLGDGDDTYLWYPGNSSDVVEGELGADTLRFDASNASDAIEVRANGSRAAVYRNIGSTTTDLGSVERVDVSARGGADAVVVRDLTGTPVTQVNVDLAAYPDSGTGDAQLDSVAVLGSAADDSIAITAEPGTVVVSGLAASVRIASSEATDQLGVYGVGGTDTFMVALGLESLITLATYQD